MRNKSRRRILRTEDSIDMSSMMDIIFILLIFVMVAVSFTKDIKSIPVDVPDVIYAKASSVPNITITIKANGKIFWDEKEISMHELESTIQQENMKKKSVLLNAEKKVEYENVVQVLDILKHAKIEKINLGVKTK